MAKVRLLVEIEFEEGGDASKVPDDEWSFWLKNAASNRPWPFDADIEVLAVNPDEPRRTLLDLAASWEKNAGKLDYRPTLTTHGKTQGLRQAAGELRDALNEELP